jgi:hypothetical protein
MSAQGGGSTSLVERCCRSPCPTLHAKPVAPRAAAAHRTANNLCASPINASGRKRRLRAQRFARPSETVRPSRYALEATRSYRQFESPSNASHQRPPDRKTRLTTPRFWPSPIKTTRSAGLEIRFRPSETINVAFSRRFPPPPAWLPKWKMAVPRSGLSL